MNFGQAYSFIDEENDKILNYETVYDKDNDIIIDNNHEKKQFGEEGIETFTPGQNNPSNMNKPGVNMQLPHKPPMRQQQIKPPKNQPPPPPKFQPQHQPHYPKNKHNRYRPPRQINNNYVYDTVVYDKPDYPYYNPYFNQYVNPYYNPYFNQPPVEVIEVNKNNNDESNNNKNDNKKNDINVTNFLLFLIVIIGLFFLMKKN